MTTQLPADITAAIEALVSAITYATEDGFCVEDERCENARATLEAAILAYRAGGGWQPIETAPTDKTPVDLWIVDRLSGLEWREPDAWYDDDWWWTLSMEGGEQPVGQPGIQDPSHWRPVPQPPTAATDLGRAALAEQGRGE